MSEVGHLKLGYLPLNFFNFPHFRGVATITWANIIWSVSNFGYKKFPRTCRSSLNMSKIGQPELGCLPLNWFNFLNFWGVATIILINIIGSVSNFKNRKVLRKTGQDWIWSKSVKQNWVIFPWISSDFPHFWGVVTITRTHIIRSVSNFGNRKVPRNHRSRLNISKISKLELGDILQKGLLSQ